MFAANFLDYITLKADPFSWAACLHESFSIPPSFKGLGCSVPRCFPQVHSFTYSYLMVAIPLRFRGSIGRLFSVPTCEYDANKPCLDVSLDDSPTVYLVTAPRFLGYQFNPVSLRQEFVSVSCALGSQQYLW
ncbi:hypothetical protein L873DRAFT_1454328 [Choiromyces venosus 120613-1]|uniref:Uncharacterized protein n=1 Tax=Choiromyces venosus 120613-1 TaxID=1336337 RepID=A0A3N4K4Q3_9PEZI|nr:hypothetical protein L873DRAFT_1454328 [Choiromyces venosus 120613-1]